MIAKYNSPSTITRTTPPPKQPTCVTKKLYKYQLEALAWMKELEDRVATGGKKRNFDMCLTSFLEAWNYSTLLAWSPKESNFNVSQINNINRVFDLRRYFTSLKSA